MSLIVFYFWRLIMWLRWIGTLAWADYAPPHSIGRSDIEPNDNFTNLYTAHPHTELEHISEFNYDKDNIITSLSLFGKGIIITTSVLAVLILTNEYLISSSPIMDQISEVSNISKHIGGFSILSVLFNPALGIVITFVWEGIVGSNTPLSIFMILGLSFIPGLFTVSNISDVLEKAANFALHLTYLEVSELADIEQDISEILSVFIFLLIYLSVCWIFVAVVF